jgi:hypothetical protein
LFRSELDYYQENGKTFFVSVTRLEYEKPIYEDGNAKVIGTSSRTFYLDSTEELCTWYLDGKVQSNDDNTKEFISYVLSTIKSNRPKTLVPRAKYVKTSRVNGF